MDEIGTTKYNQDIGILAVQLGHMNESQKRIEGMLKDLRTDMKSELSELRKEIKSVDERHTEIHKDNKEKTDKKIEEVDTRLTKESKTISNKLDLETKTTLKFRVQLLAFTSAGSLFGAMVWQFITYISA